MISAKSRFLRYCATCALIAGAMLAGRAQAQQVAANASSALATQGAGGIETVVVTGTAFDPESAPAKARLETTEPQTIINKSYIEDSVSETADYTTILAIAPGMTGFDTNGPGLSDGGVKNTMRGLPDGSYGITYDGIPFGDTNGPSHHSESYFPATTIGSIDVDRGPGNAGNMGASTYGGSINMFSEGLTTDTHARVAATAGSWGTSMFNANYQTGDFDIGGLNNRAMINFQDTNSTGYLTYQGSAAKNILIKTQTELAPGWTLTLFANYNALFQNLERQCRRDTGPAHHLRQGFCAADQQSGGRHLCALQPCPQENRHGLSAPAGRSRRRLCHRQHRLYLCLCQQDVEHDLDPADRGRYHQGDHRRQWHHRRREIVRQ